MKFVLASNNAKKLVELREILGKLDIEVISLHEAGIFSNPEENGKTFRDNAIIKAESACRLSGLPALADDSGLVVDALGGEPGVYSARYGGEGLTDIERYELLLKNMEGKTDRTARFVSCIAAVFPNGDVITAQGTCEGDILTKPAGNGGFGYDRIFWSKDLQQSLGEAEPDEKNAISHRGRALRSFSKLLEEYMGD